MSHTVKTVFYTLFAVIITILALSLWLVFLYPSEGPVNSKKIDISPNKAHFQVSTTKDELEQAINQYVRDEVQMGDLSFSVSLDNDLQLYGDVRILGIKVPIRIGFDPVLQQSGDLVLEQRYFQVGALSMPASALLEYLNRSYTFPEWILLQPAQKKIYLATTNMSANSKIDVQVQKFDLSKDELLFDVYLIGDH